MRIIGLDVGRRRIGIAISDASQTLARPVGVVQTDNIGPGAAARVAEEIARLEAGDDRVSAIVMGLPRRLDGSANEMTGDVQRFATLVEQRTQLPVALQDERLSSVEAESRLAAREKDWRARKARIDAAAAAIILQDYLDALPRIARAEPGDDIDV